MSRTDHSRLQAWISHIFDHPVASARYCAEDAPTWEGAWEDVPTLIAETFERSGELLAEFSDAQLDQGFWYLFGPRSGDFTEKLIDSKIPLAERIRAIRSFTPLFEQVMAARCSSRLGHLEKLDQDVLNSSCYMWWDWLWYELCLGAVTPTPPITTEIVEALRRQLTIPHDACRVSALHGIGHWVKTIPEVASLVDEFLASNPDLRPELIEYAERAKAGQVM